MRQRRTPDFVVIGEQKCGTGWLLDRFREHPGIYMPRHEVKYFSSRTNYARGMDWYLRHFRHARADQVIGEKSPEYMWLDAPGADRNRNVDELIDRDLPEARLILCLRNPMDRALSAILHHVRAKGRRINPHQLRRLGAGAFLYGPHAEIGSRYGVVERGFYAERLQRLQKRFGERLLVLVAEQEIMRNAETGLRRALQHIGAASQWQSERLHHNRKARKPSYGTLVTGYWIPPLLKPARKLALGRPFDLPDRAEAHERLWALYREDIAATEKLLGRPLPEWRLTP